MIKLFLNLLIFCILIGCNGKLSIPYDSSEHCPDQGIRIHGSDGQQKRYVDQYNIRYTVIQKDKNPKYDFIFIPGGPGCDSSYLLPLVTMLKFPGNVYLLDFPGSGTHFKGYENYNYDRWFSIFLPSLKQFKNPVLIGHSFGGMLPLLYPELEHLLKGFIILNSAPCLWLEDAVKYAEKFKLPDIRPEMKAFTTDPSQETFNTALSACTLYYFHPNFLKQGRKLFESFAQKNAFLFKPAVWWQRIANKINYNARWIPGSVPTLIISGEFDCIVPYTLFLEDKRFKRSNIKHVHIKGAGHMPWVEKPNETKCIMQNFLKESLK